MNYESRSFVESGSARPSKAGTKTPIVIMSWTSIEVVPLMAAGETSFMKSGMRNEKAPAA